MPNYVCGPHTAAKISFLTFKTSFWSEQCSVMLKTEMAN